MCSQSPRLSDVHGLYMSPVTFLWRGIKDREADRFYNGQTCFGHKINGDVAAVLAVLRKEFAIWNDVKMSQTPSITFSQQHSAERKVIRASAKGALHLYLVGSARDDMHN